MNFSQLRLNRFNCEPQLEGNLTFILAMIAAISCIDPRVNFNADFCAVDEPTTYERKVRLLPGHPWVNLKFIK